MPAGQGVSIDALRTQLAAALGAEAGRGAFWGDSSAMAKALEDVRRRHDNPAGKPVAADRIARAVAAFRRDGKVAGYVQLRHVCLGAASVDAEGRCLLAEVALRERLFDLAETIPGARRQLKCFQALLRGYWAFPRFGDVGADVAAAGEALRHWLGRRRASLAQADGRKSFWLDLLGEHANLLGDSPCERYGAALLRGEGAALQAVVEGLSIPNDSWVKAEAVLAQMRAATALGDADWLAVLPQLLDIAAGKAGIEVPPALAQRCIALLLSRHARSEAVEYHEPLLDAAIASIGNPWQRRAVWDALVLNPAGKPCELAREMVNGWLKDLLIAEFFRRHASGDASAARRAAYWQRYVPFIGALWVGLNGRTMALRGEAHERHLRLAAGCLLLIDAADDDNALLMRIGDFLVVESGGRDRELLLYRWSKLDGRLARRLGSARDAKYFSLSGLLALQHEARFPHRDDEAGGTWESRFDESLRPLLWRSL